MQILLRVFFQLLYHPFAWSYDLVAELVSLGRWKSWVLSALPWLDGRVLELGFGPGHLQTALRAGGTQAYGLDESRPMCRQAGDRLRRRDYPLCLTQGYAQYLPFAGETFERVAATFPSEYIFEAQTLAEIRRVLRPGGLLVIVPSAWISGKSPLERLAAGLFRVTGQAGKLDVLLPGIQRRIAAAGFVVRHELVEQEGSRVLVVIASKFF